MLLRILPLLTLLLLTSVCFGVPRVTRVIDVAPVWSGHPVGLMLATHGNQQFVAFYDAQQQLTVGVRTLDADQWSFQTLDTKVGWDSHNYIAMAFDDDDQIHIAANMHAVPLIYFRTTKALDIHSFERVTSMTGSEEEKCTYPVFMRGPANEFIFTYRSGYSGNGNQIYNVYDQANRAWHRLLDKPLTDGNGLANAYLVGPARGPDGYFHLCWVWREEGDCATNHDLSYARSKDLKHWEKGDGTPLALPLTLTNADVVDPVPVNGGIINGNTKIGFDSKKRVIISYHKFDPAGLTQAYSARLEDGKWVIYQTSNWDYRWDFRGGGSIQFEIRIGSVNAGRNGTLTQTFRHAKLGDGIWTLDDATLKPTATTKPAATHSPELDKVESTFPDMSIRWQGDAGRSPKPGVRYELRWETLGVHRDKPRNKPWPEASMLRVYEFAQ